ncbi:MAG: alpha-L-fucosidase [Prevotellaceae bacterium]|jgi:alpha-L-fucosidase|nr:alpha-L-fucosidase [Prevotellaceae bacterium]
MKFKTFITIFFGMIICQPCAMRAQETPAWAKESVEKREQRMAWWRHDRFGMFIHWGLYALPARHEWVKNHEKISDENYQKYFDRFDPDLFNPKEWAAKAREAGMKYVVITTKHHDGFCLWDSKYTDFKATKTPYGKDLIKPFVEAFRAEGLRIGFYYSLIDWHHPDFTYDYFHPNGPQNSEERKTANANRDIKKYQQYLKDQITEIMTQFGQIDELFLDFSYPGADGKGRNDWDSENLIKLIRKLQPQILIDDRADLNDTDWGWDFKTPEQYMPSEWPTVNGKRVAWETCQTFSGSWGYHRDEQSWKNVRQLLTMLIEVTSKGGNLLLNVGPTARGLFDDRANASLEGMGQWMKYHSRSIYGCTQAPEEFTVPKNCLLTYNPERKRLYIHILEWPIHALRLPAYAGKFKYAQLLNDASEARYKTEDNNIIFDLPLRKPPVEIPVIELFLE